MRFLNIALCLIAITKVIAFFRTDDGDDFADERLKQHEEKIKHFMKGYPEGAQKCLHECMSKCPTESRRRDIGLNCMTPCIEHCAGLKSVQDEMDIKAQKLAELLKSVPEGFCVGGLDANYESPKTLLEYFAKGPCSPLLLVPGVTATRLVVTIDCEVFRENEAKIFEKCGWNACSKKAYEFFKSVPDPEYDLWIPSVMSPLSIFTISEKSNLCFSSLIKPHYKLDQPVESMFEPRKGVKILLNGFSNKTKDKGYCGGSAISNLLPISLQTNASLGFANVIKSLEHIGYVSGLTMQPLPYNFYYSYKNNEFKINFKTALDRLNKLTGKKVTIVAHSMGNLNVLYNLKQMSQDEKKNKIFNWVTIGAPFLGSPKSQKTLVSGSDEYITLNGYFGFHLKAFILTTSNQMSLYELSAIDPFKIYDGQPWFEDVKKRMKYEEPNSNIPYEESGIPFWPPTDDLCHESFIKNVDTGCRINFYDVGEKPLMEIGDEVYRIKDSHKLIQNYNLTFNAPNLFDKLYDESLTLTNPEVPVIMIYAGSVLTQNYFKYTSDFKQKIDNGIYPNPIKVESTLGDGTVPTYSSILPGLKWAFEYENRPDPLINYQPVKFVEFCGIGHTFNPIYDKRTPSAPYQITDNMYVGLNCECNFTPSKDNYDDCSHASMHTDSHIIKLIFEIATSNQRAPKETLDYIATLDNEELENEISECKHIKPSIFE